MADTYLVEIDLELMCEHATAAEQDGRVWTENEIREWLHENGFTSVPNGWVCEEISLEVLNRSEYQNATQLY